MDYTSDLKFHFKPKKGWINDPNGLIYYKGYYHVFFQHCPNYEKPRIEHMYWGHAITKDFLSWQELPIALSPTNDYDDGGCWSGTATIKDGKLFLIYSSIKREVLTGKQIQTVSVAYSDDGINFTKYENNPVIREYPKGDGAYDFRDPAISYFGCKYRLIMASGNDEKTKARLLLYESDDIFNWQYKGIISEWNNAIYAECPSLIPVENGFILSASVCYFTYHEFSITFGDFIGNKYVPKISACIDKGPDQYAGQIFKDDNGRVIMISWLSGWEYEKSEKCIGALSVPKEILIKNGKIYAYPIKEFHHLLKDSDPSVKITDDGFIIEREGRSTVKYKGKISDIKILRDEYYVEVFVNGGEEVYTAIL